jgi:hypothetical protein
MVQGVQEDSKGALTVHVLLSSEGYDIQWRVLSADDSCVLLSGQSGATVSCGVVFS